MRYTYYIWDMDKAGTSHKGGIGRFVGATPDEAIESMLSDDANAYGAERLLVTCLRAAPGSSDYDAPMTNLGGWGIFEIEKQPRAKKVQP